MSPTWSTLSVINERTANCTREIHATAEDLSALGQHEAHYSEPKQDPYTRWVQIHKKNDLFYAVSETGPKNDLVNGSLCLCWVQDTEAKNGTYPERHSFRVGRKCDEFWISAQTLLMSHASREHIRSAGIQIWIFQNRWLF